MAYMYYSSESSDSDNMSNSDKKSLDLSNLMLDNDHLANSLKKSIRKLYSKEYRKESFDEITERLFLAHNMLVNIPFELVLFQKLRVLDIANNNLTQINDFILELPELVTLSVKNNELDDNSLPKDLSSLTKLKEVNLSGNHLSRVPSQLYGVTSLKYLYLGDNSITHIPPGIEALQSLQMLQLGGNQLGAVPEALAQLGSLQSLVLCHNALRRLPRAISRLKRLRSLQLHGNQLCCLPVEIVCIQSLQELSLRENPLVSRFIASCAKEQIAAPPSLKELAARTVSGRRVPYGPGDLPRCLLAYLQSAHKCVNPNCKGVYFTSCVQHVKLVDFCGMYRVPLMHYLCSSRCTSQTPSSYARQRDTEDSDDDTELRRRVLLG